ncbi:unnamed protein product [Zymoseptoria tritici ST99CH_3D7]|uniref:Uncharacterized protein n=1 Tax=Zymoseptoria tritici (strain ST99CH_3D7) TaxID=1276538 RepID=A0A1X7RU74_ZYMT9|nr:unnamed protein product [Zymoseptoria tritici ST99CH_3D7]
MRPSSWSTSKGFLRSAASIHTHLSGALGTPRVIYLSAGGGAAQGMGFLERTASANLLYSRSTYPMSHPLKVLEYLARRRRQYRKGSDKR